MTVARRSCLVVPGHQARMHEKALDAGADEVVFDLEDAVALDGKAAAREQVAATLRSDAWAGRTVAVRVNTGDEQAADLSMLHELAAVRAAASSAAARGGGALSIVVPKVESAGDVAAAAAVAPVQALIEAAVGLAAAADVAHTEGVVALILGYADLAASLGRRGDQAPWIVAQETLVAAARRGGAQAIDGPFFGIRDARGLALAARTTRALGFDGKWAIHPAQVGPINAAFGATAEERAWAQAVVDAVRGSTGAASLDGQMVDEAMVRQAERLLSLPAARSGVDECPNRTEIHTTPVAAAHFDDLPVGRTFASPGLTLTDGHAALHQAIVGDRLRLSLDAELYARVTGTEGLLAHPMLVCDVAIGQSTQPSMRVLGNLFYRGLGARPVPVGTTLRTTTEVVARRPASGRRGIVALRVTTVDGAGVPVLDFWRAPLLPAREDPGDDTADDFDRVGERVDVSYLVPTSWDLAPLREQPLGPLFDALEPGAVFDVEAGETVTSAPELARLSLNVAHAHTDARASSHGERLVYGGHVIGIAAAHVTRALPDLATILAWESCDHLGPCFEGDRLRSTVEVTEKDAPNLVRLRVRTRASSQGEPDRDILDWKLIGLMP